MIKYEIIEKRAKFGKGLSNRIRMGCTLESFDYEPRTARSYDTKAEAEKEFAKIKTRIEKMGRYKNTYYVVTEYYLQKTGYNHKDNFFECIKIYKLSPIIIKLLDLTNNKIIKVADNIPDIERTWVNLSIKNQNTDYKIILPDDIYY